MQDEETWKIVTFQIVVYLKTIKDNLTLVPSCDLHACKRDHRGDYRLFL